MTSLMVRMDKYTPGNAEHQQFMTKFKAEHGKMQRCFARIARYDCPCKKRRFTEDDLQEQKNVHMRELWGILHDLSFCYPTNTPELPLQNIMRALLDFELAQIPCPVCRAHYVSFKATKNLNVVCRRRLNLATFLIDLHNDVNKRLGKPVLSFAQAFKLYGHDR